MFARLRMLLANSSLNGIIRHRDASHNSRADGGTKKSGVSISVTRADVENEFTSRIVKRTPMNIITMNFGPEALPDAGAIAQAADMLAQHQRSGNALIVVVSALPGVSEMLQESIDLSSYARAHNKLLSIHTSAARKLVQEARDRALLIQDVTDILETYNWMGRSMVNRSATPPEAAAVLAVGERLSARLLAGHLQNRGVQVVHAGEMIVTDDEYCAATPDEAGTRQRSADKLMPLLAEGYIVIVGNGSGTTPEGRATRLNDSYQTASLLAACAQASGLWLMTNRDGILTADPELTP